MNTKLLKYILLLLAFVLCGPLKFRKAHGMQTQAMKFGQQKCKAKENDSMWLYDGLGCPFVVIITSNQQGSIEESEHKELGKKIAEEAMAFGNGKNFRSAQDQSTQEQQRLDNSLQKSKQRAVVKDYKIEL